MDYMYIVGLLILVVVISALIFVTLSLFKKRQSIIVTAVRFNNEMEQRIIDLDCLMASIEEKGQVLSDVSLVLQDSIKHYALYENARGDILSDTDFVVFESKKTSVDPREISASGELKQKHFGVAGYLESIKVKVARLSNATESYLNNIYTSIGIVEKRISGELKLVSSLQQEVGCYISAIQSNISGDVNEIVNPQDKELIASLAKMGKELSLLRSRQIEVQLVVTALLDALAGALKVEYAKAG